MKKWTISGIAVAAAFAASAMGQNQWNEDGDAGNLPSTAQVPSGSGALTQINGSYSSTSDSDMYLIHIDDPSSFRASTVNLATVDTQLFLFDANGFGVTFNDDDPSGVGGLRSVITGAFVSGAGDYYIATGQYDTDATSGGQEIWLDQPYGVERAPDGPGAGGVVDGWGSQFGSTGNYGIALTGVSYPGGGGPTLSVDGTCPGSVTLHLEGGTPSGQVAFAYAFGEGNQTIPPSMPCGGTELGLNATATLLQVVTADANGHAMMTGNAPAAACGRVFVQAVDLGSCGTSNVESL